MLEFKGEILNVETNVLDSTCKITFKMAHLGELINEMLSLINKRKIVEIKDFRRTKDANAYFWVLCGKLASKLKLDASEIYREMVATSVGDNYEYDVFMDKTYDRSVADWESRGLGWTVKDIQKVTVDYEHKGKQKQAFGKMVLKYYGSSKFDKAQMGRLIDECVARCKEQGIETMTPDELTKLKSLWGE